MKAAASPEERAEVLVTVGRKVPGGPWFVELRELLKEPVYLGPYPNPAVATEDARRVRQYLAALLRQAGGAAG